MAKSDRTGQGRPRRRKWSQKQIERLVAVIGVTALVAIIGVYLMIRAWGVWGLILRFLGVVLAVFLCWLAWKFRRPLWAWTRQGVRFLIVAAWAAITRKPSAFRALVRECTPQDAARDQQGSSLVPVSRLAALLDIQARLRLTPAQSGRICEIAERDGYGLEPDARLINKPYRTDDLVAAFPSPSGDRASPERYGVAACFLRMGLAIAAADGPASPGELALLIAQLDQLLQLNQHEHCRLQALTTLLTATENDLAALGPVIAALNADQKQAVAKLLLVVAAEDGVVTKEEVRALRKLHKALGFEKEVIDQALASLRKIGQAPVTVRPAGPVPAGLPRGAGEAIPSPPAEAAGGEEEAFRLDHAAIAAIMDDTRQVAHMLAEAMKADVDASIRPTPKLAVRASLVLRSEAASPLRGVAFPGQTSWGVPTPAEQQVSTVGAGLAELDDAPTSRGEADILAAERTPAGETAVTGETTPVEAASPPGADPSPPQAPEANPAPPPDETDPTLPAPYASFYQLLVSRKEWPVKEIAVLARRQGLMFSAAIDALNEWATQKHGGRLFIEDGPTLFVEHEYLS